MGLRIRLKTEKHTTERLSGFEDLTIALYVEESPWRACPDRCYIWKCRTLFLTPQDTTSLSQCAHNVSSHILSPLHTIFVSITLNNVQNHVFCTPLHEKPVPMHSFLSTQKEFTVSNHKVWSPVHRNKAYHSHNRHCYQSRLTWPALQWWVFFSSAQIGKSPLHWYNQSDYRAL